MIRYYLARAVFGAVIGTLAGIVYVAAEQRHVERADPYAPAHCWLSFGVPVFEGDRYTGCIAPDPFLFRG